jgi:hypothetical protein
LDILEDSYLNWYADNSELIGIKGAEIPDIFLFGGLIIDHDAECKLQADVERIKKIYSYPNIPIKWNMKDLRDLYESKGMLDLYKRVIMKSRLWRTEIFKCLSATNCVLLVACIEGYSSKRRILKERKEELSRFNFANGLMRFGLHVSEYKPNAAQVILDWPDKGLSKPFDSEYGAAYYDGKTIDKKNTYRCGKLSSLKFADSVFFANMHYNIMLQIADLIVGATREFIECCLRKKEGGQGLDCLKLVREKFRGAPEQIIGRGLIVPFNNIKLLAAVKKGVKELLYAA